MRTRDLIVLTLLTCVVVAAPRHVLAQEAGVKGGGTFASMPISLEDGNIYTGRLHVGVAAGGFVAMPLGKSAGLQIDGLVQGKGTRDQNGEHITLTYLDVPVLLRFVQIPYGHATLHAYAGPSFSFKIAESDNLSTLSQTVFGGSVADHVKTFDPGVTIGGDVFGKHVIGDFRYTWGVTDIRDLPQKSGSVKNRALTVMIGYRFGR